MDDHRFLPKSLPEQARLLAVSDVAAMFDEPSKLQNLRQAKTEYERKLLAVETQLVAGTQAQLDEMQQSRELLFEAKKEMEKVRSNFEAIEERCVSCSQAIGGFDAIRDVKNARQNLQSVVNQLDVYSVVPTQVAELGEILESDPKALRSVFLEWSRLRIWKDEILEQVQVDVDQAKRREQEIKNRGEEQQSFSLSWRTSVQAQSQMQKVLGEHFDHIKDLGEKILAKVFKILENFLDLGQFDAPTLVTALEIVERTEHQYAHQRRRAMLKGRNLEFILNLYPLGKVRRQAIRHIEYGVKEKLDAFLPVDNSLQPNLGECGNNGHDEEETKQQIYAVLAKANTLIVDLKVVNDEISKCFPPEYDIVSLFRRSFEERVACKLELFMETDLASSDMLHIVGWLNCFIEQVKEIRKLDNNSRTYFEGNSALNTDLKHDTQFSDSKSHKSEKKGKAKTEHDILIPLMELEENESRAFRLEQLPVETYINRFMQHCIKLMSKYVGRAFPRLMEYVTRLVDRDNPPEVNPEGNYQTSVPQDLFNIISQEISVVTHHQIKGSQMATFAIDACLKALTIFQNANMNRLSAISDLELICAFVNDNETMYDLCDSPLSMDLEPSLRDYPKQKDAVFDGIDKIATGFIQAAEHGVDLAVAHIFRVIESSEILNEAFSDGWLNKTVNHTKVMCVTFEDYFDSRGSGLRYWFATDIYFGKTVAGVMNRALKTYVEGLLLRPTPFTNIQKCVARIRDDRNNFRDFFSKYLDVLVYGKIYNENVFESRLKILGLIADFMESNVPQSYFEELATEFQSDVSTAVTRLLFLNGCLTQREQLELRHLIDSSEYSSAMPARSIAATRFDMDAVAKLNAATDWSTTGVFGDSEAGAESSRNIFSRMKMRMTSGIAEADSSTVNHEDVKTLSLTDFLAHR